MLPRATRPSLTVRFDFSVPNQANFYYCYSTSQAQRVLGARRSGKIPTDESDFVAELETSQPTVELTVTETCRRPPRTYCAVRQHPEGAIRRGQKQWSQARAELVAMAARSRSRWIATVGSARSFDESPPPCMMIMDDAMHPCMVPLLLKPPIISRPFRCQRAIQPP
jgi:hypothetical protein